MDGILNVYKEAGYTSHDVVAKLRGILHQKKVGHTGTLDPEATGVLPVCIGKATKVCELLSDRDKTYQAVCRLGLVTDTQDSTGNVLEEFSFKNITEKKVEEAVFSFAGEGLQVPPMYSALKVDGRKLYEYAREGKTIVRKPRKIFISSIQILQMNLEEGTFTMEISCSKGTYIRTLCHDIGQKLGVGAVMESLVRIRVGEFQAKYALTLEKIESFMKQGEAELRKHVYTVDALFPGVQRMQIQDSYQGMLDNGNYLESTYLSPFLPEELNKEEEQMQKQLFRITSSKTEKKENPKILVYDTEGKFKAIYQWEDGRYTVAKMF